MKPITLLDKIAITVHARRILQIILLENPTLEKILHFSANETEALNAVRNWILPKLKKNPIAEEFYMSEKHNLELATLLSWENLAAIRILDYINHAGDEYPDQNIGGEIAITNPIKMLWLATNFGIGGAKPGFFTDMLQLLRQLNGKLLLNPPTKKQLLSWMERYPSGIDPKIIELRKINKTRIIKILIDKIDNREIPSRTYHFKPGLSFKQKEEKMQEWWKESKFHLSFAIRSPEMLNEMLDYSLDPDTMNILYKAKEKEIPFFVNPYYLSLLNVHTPDIAVGADLAIRCYIIYSQQLVEEFGSIVAWEKEDKVEPGKPNTAGWILPSHNIHRRYPEVAIFIPDTVGRACGGLCSSCQRLYDFQSRRYNFDLQKLKPTELWNERLPKLLEYFKYDAQLRDILITGGDALMSSDKSLKQILDEIYEMARQKKEENRSRPENEKYAEIVRVRIGTRLPVYIPQRITPELTKILSDFKVKAQKIGIQQFVIQTHFQSPMEITPESQKAIKLLLESEWAVTNQLVFTTAASRRGHAAKLRQVLNEIGILSYYTLTVKGFKENSASFAPNSRTVQEQMEEKIYGLIPEDKMEFVQNLLLHPQIIKEKIVDLQSKNSLPFLSTDRNILNLPGVGKSLTFRTIGITRYGRRILEFDHDQTRKHSPIINKMGKVVIIESKSIAEYLEQLEDMGENPAEYEGIYGYSIGQTEPRMAMYEYPKYDYVVTKEFTNLEI
ncbi:MAG: KamA family protein [Bacteroidetes bacterium]|nr:KamA family protein [Bacteroidota bacterium]